ncbi:MAG: glutaredoxin domain-containing protein [Myxococcota bacterium]
MGKGSRILAMALLAIVTSGFTPPEGDQIMLFGAPWCEACAIQRGMLDRCGFPFQYLDVSTDAGFQAYAKVRAGASGLPLVVMHGFRIQTWDLESFRFLLQRHLGLEKKKCKASIEVNTSAGMFGGHDPAWWAAQEKALSKVVREKKGFEAEAAKDALQLLQLDAKLIKVPKR